MADAATVATAEAFEAARVMPSTDEGAVSENIAQVDLTPYGSSSNGGGGGSCDGCGDGNSIGNKSPDASCNDLVISSHSGVSTSCTGVSPQTPPASPEGHRSPMKSMRDRLAATGLTIQAPVRRPQRLCPLQAGQKAATVFRQLAAGQTISDLYVFGEEIYDGGAKGRVVLAKRLLDDSEVVVKVRFKYRRRGERAWRAIMSQVHSMGGSQHVLDIMEIVEASDAFYVVMPKCNGGELFEFLATEAEVPEAECKRIIREVLIAVGHLHENNLIHRDIKPENIMFDKDANILQSPKTVKLIDFDTCLEWSPGTPKSKCFVGTPGYIAPEALLGEISPQSDLWSVGVIMYILMTGEMPWSSLVSLEDGIVGSPGALQMYNALKAEVLAWDQEPWPDFPLARDLCQKLLAFSVDERLSAVSQALSHPWLGRA